MAKISIIIPVYNVEKYLKRCLDSVLAQTFTDFEVILIDNCSLDESFAICKEYAQRDSRIKVFQNEKNNGLSFSRNKGIDLSLGEYIAFVDSDDYVVPEYLELLLTTLEKYQCDVVQLGFYHVINEVVHWNNGLIEHYEYENEKAYGLLYGDGDKNILNFMVWNKLFRRELVGDIRFSSLRCEDVIFVSRMVMRSKKVVVSTQPVYYYCRHDDSVMGQMQQDIKNMIRSHLFAYRAIAENAIESTQYIQDLSNARLATYYISAIKNKILKGDTELKKMLKEDKKRFKFFNNKKIPLIKRIVLAIGG